MMEERATMVGIGAAKKKKEMTQRLARKKERFCTSAKDVERGGKIKCNIVKDEVGHGEEEIANGKDPRDDVEAKREPLRWVARARAPGAEDDGAAKAKDHEAEQVVVEEGEDAGEKK